ncbi:MAG: PDZ domain-containing protein [Candidatus Tenebribacter davisii]|nr:PDZ domain-containing protein [Candidatus Tenebribacter davisii]
MRKIVMLILIGLLLFSIPLFARSKVRMGLILNGAIDEQYGVLVKKVSEESPAEKAGLKLDDLILKIDGEKIYTVDQIKKMLLQYEPEQKLKITFKRGKVTDTCSLKLEERKVPEVPKRTYMGVFLKDLDEEIKETLKLKKSYGILISEVVKDSPAEKAGLKDKDVLLTFDNEKIYTTDQLIKMLKNYKPDDKIKLEIVRGKKTKKLNILLGEKEDTTKYLFTDKEGSFSLFDGPENVMFYQYDLPGSNKWIGVKLNINKEKKNVAGKEDVTQTTTIMKVIEGTPAAKAGLKYGDEIVAIEGNKKLMLREAVKDKKIGDKILLTIKRDGKEQDIPVEIGERGFLESEKNVEVTIEDGEIRVIIDGEEKTMSDLENLNEGKNKNVKMIKSIKIDEMNDVKKDLRKVKKEMKNIDFNIEILNDTNDEL